MTDKSMDKPSKMQTLRKWVLRLALVLAILGPLLLLIAPLGAKAGLWDWRFGLIKITFNTVPPLLMAGLAVGVIALVLSLLVKPRRGFLITGISIALPLIVLAQMGGVKKKGGANPIHDITTDTQNVPQFTDVILSERANVQGVNSTDYIGKKVGMGDQEGKPIAAFQTKTYPDIKPIVVADAPAVVFGEAKAAAKALGWDIKSENLEDGMIEATDTTFWYDFKDDIVIRIKPGVSGGSVVDIRSISRVGMSDLGANADRIRAFTKILQD